MKLEDSNWSQTIRKVERNRYNPKEIWKSKRRHKSQGNSRRQCILCIDLNGIIKRCIMKIRIALGDLLARSDIREISELRQQNAVLLQTLSAMEKK